MPLAKVTDLTYERTIVGRLLGYGVFVIESAGQQQALSRIAYIPHPDQLYHEVSGLLFGSSPSTDDGTGSTGGNNAGTGGPSGPPRPPGPPGPPHPDRPLDPSGPHGPSGDLWVETGPEPEQAQRPDAPPIDLRTDDELPWELPQRLDQRANAPTAPLPSIS